MRQRILMILLAFALASAWAARANNWNVELVGKTPEGLYVNDVFALDNYAYLCTRSGLVILNISDPSNPIEVDQAYVPVSANAIHVSSGYAYVVGYELRVIDISDPAAPQEVGICGTSGYAQGVHVSGDYAYVADSADGLRVVDISNPSNPQEVGGCDTPRYAQGVYVSGSYGYVADGEGGLRVIDISDPSNPQEVGFYSRPGEINEAMGVHVSGDYAYVAYGGAAFGYTIGVLDAGGANLGEAGLCVVDISNPTAPQEVGFYQTCAQGVHVSDGYAYVVTGWGGPSIAGLGVIDISDPSNPQEVGFCDMPEPAFGVYVSGEYAYVVTNSSGSGLSSGLRVVDISNPAVPREVGFCDIPGDAWGVYISGSHAYVAQSIGTPPILDGGLWVIDISDPTNPREVGFCDMPDPASGVHVSDGYAYVATGWDGLRVVDISDPSNPWQVGFYDTPSCARSVYVSGDYAYVVCGCGAWSGVLLLVLDITNPSAPQEVARYDTPGGTEAENVYVSGGYVYVADGLGGLLIFRHADAYTTAVTPTDKKLATWADLKMTKAFQNYPNPCNPETWIPYSLAEQSRVVVEIHTATGRLVRRLDLGIMPAGVYSSKEKAAYWDGCDEDGDAVASGVYFYTLHAGSYKATKKMVVAQ